MSFFSGVPLMECCRVDDTNTIIGLPPGWMDTDVSRLYVASIPLSQVVRWRPRGLFQSLDDQSDALTAWWWPCLESERAMWPKKWSRLVLVILETGGQPVLRSSWNKRPLNRYLSVCLEWLEWCMFLLSYVVFEWIWILVSLWWMLIFGKLML